MNVVRLDEQITRRHLVYFLSKNHGLTLFHHDTDPKFLWNDMRIFIIDMMIGLETKNMLGVLMVQDNQIINKSNTIMRLLGSTSEPNGREDGI